MNQWRLRLALGLLGALLVSGAAFAAPDEWRGAIQRAKLVRAANQDALFQRPGVVGVGIGQTPAGKPRIQVLTKTAGVTGLPTQLGEFEVATLVTGSLTSGELAAQSATEPGPTERWPRPVPIGVSTGHTSATAGTIGCQVGKGNGCHTEFYLLSNNHVIANKNQGVPGDIIVQPGPIDGGNYPGDLVGVLVDFEPIEFSTTASNVIDAAIAGTDDSWSRRTTPSDGYGAPREGHYATATLGMPVMKYGRTTRMTTGTVVGIDFTVMVEYSAGDARFVDQVIVQGDNGEPFHLAGDSGALAVVSGTSQDGKAMGLIFAGNESISILNPILPVLLRFGVFIVGD